MEKKSTVITPKGYTIKVADHMLGDLAKFGATSQRPILKPTPKEILNMPKKIIAPESNLPEMEVTGKIVNSNLLPDAIPVPVNIEPKVRKTPVRSKSKT